jgi:hypothetical protein
VKTIDKTHMLHNTLSLLSAGSSKQGIFMVVVFIDVDGKVPGYQMYGEGGSVTTYGLVVSKSFEDCLTSTLWSA